MSLNHSILNGYPTTIPASFKSVVADSADFLDLIANTVQFAQNNTGLTLADNSIIGSRQIPLTGGTACPIMTLTMGTTGLYAVGLNITYRVYATDASNGIQVRNGTELLSALCVNGTGSTGAAIQVLGSSTVVTAGSISAPTQTLTYPASNKVTLNYNVTSSGLSSPTILCDVIVTCQNTPSSIGLVFGQ